MSSPVQFKQYYGQYSLSHIIMDHFVKLSPAYNYCDLVQSTVAR